MPAEVAVCIPTYNRAELLREAIRSVLDQTYTQFQLVIADNASTDATREMVADFHDKRIHYYRQPRNVSIGANHRFATQMAKMANTEFIAILADDDLYEPDHLTTALTALAEYPDVAYFTCALDRFGACEPGIWRPAGITDATTPLIHYRPRQAVQFLGLENPGFLNTVVVRSDRFRNDLFWGKAGFVHMDVLIMTQLMIQGGCLYANRPTVRYRFHSANISRALHNAGAARRLLYMLHYAIRYLAQLLLDTATCTPSDIEAHGLSIRAQDAAMGVMSLASFHSSPTLRTIARRVFDARTDIDDISRTCRLARRVGFFVLPIREQIGLMGAGWRP